MYPERWDAWFRYADFLWHEGGAFVDDGRPTALQAFNRAIALDSVGHDEAWRHLSEHYVLTGNQEAFLALPPEHQDRGVGVVLTLMDSQSGIDPREREWFEGSYFQPMYGLMEFQAAGAAMGEAERLARILEQRAEGGDGNSAQVAGVFAMNRGRPELANRLLELASTPSPSCGGNVCQEPLQWLWAAVLVEGMADFVRPLRDSLAASFSVEAIEDIGSSEVQRRIAAGTMVELAFWIAVWDLVEGDPAGAEDLLEPARRMGELAEHRRWTRLSRVIVSFLEAFLEIASESPTATQAVAAADSAYARGGLGRSTIGLRVLLAELYQRSGDREKALRVLQRIWMVGGEEYVWFLSDRLLDRARLAADLGYRDAAIQSYEHYLTLMSDPELAFEEKVGGVRAELEALQAD